MFMSDTQTSSRAPRRELNLADYPRGQHTSIVFERLDDFGPDDHLSVVCGYDPEPLRRKIEAWCRDEFEWTSIATGPLVWRAEITPAAASAGNRASSDQVPRHEP
jgi:uncharacterized protein (DUF2249 family)